MPASPPGSRWAFTRLRLNLRHPWATTMSTSEYRDTILANLTRDGITGLGEGAPIVRYRENAEDGLRALESIRPVLETLEPSDFQRHLAAISEGLPGQFAAKAAVDIAVLDWVGKRLGLPLFRLLGLDPDDAPITSYSIGIADREVTQRKVLEADPYPVLKVKMGLQSDEATLAAIREVTDKPIRVDGNEGWKDRETALRKIQWLESQGVEFVEQPMPAEMISETRWVRSRVGLPIVADEAATDVRGLSRLVGAYDVVNVKLDKCGGIQEALRMIHAARALGLKTMLGCMVASSVSITAAAHLSPLADYADLDGNLLISNDPYQGVTVRGGRLILPRDPGLGVSPSGT